MNELPLQRVGSFVGRVAWQQRDSSSHVGSLSPLPPHITSRRGYLCVIAAEVEGIATRVPHTGIVPPDTLPAAKLVGADWCPLPRTTPDWSLLGLVLPIELAYWCETDVGSYIMGPTELLLQLWPQTWGMLGLLTFPHIPWVCALSA